MATKNEVQAVSDDLSTLSEQVETNTTNIGLKANKTDIETSLVLKENIANKVSDKLNITDAAQNYPSVEYLGQYYYDAVEAEAHFIPKTNESGGGVITDYIADKAVTSAKLAQPVIDLINSKANKTTILNSSETTVILTPMSETEYRYSNTLTSLTLTLPSELADDYIIGIVFTSGETATAMIYPDTIKWIGDGVVDNVFVPVVSKTYNIILWFDGCSIYGVVKGGDVE